MVRRFNRYDVTIASGQSLSAIQTLGNKELPSSLEIDTGWTPAVVSVRAGFSADSVKDFYKDGAEYTISGIGSDRVIALPLNDLIGLRNIQFRSGTTGLPITQSGVRSLTFVTIELD